LGGADPWRPRPGVLTLTGMTPYVMVQPRKSLIVGYLLWFFLGVLGVHRFYTGRWVTGLIWLFTGGLIGVGWLVDAVLTFFMVTKPK